jgi:signal transduction histidine kinase
MQAQPQSSPAARIPSAPPTASPAAPLPLSPPATSPATASLANTIGLAHDAGNLLAALGLYCDLLNAPGVLRPEHRHYATELSLISNRSSELIRRLLSLPVAPAPEPAETGASTPPSTSPILTFPNTFPDAFPNQETSNAAATNHASALRNLAPILQSIATGAATVSVICPISLPPLDFSSEILERITVNLVRNAAEAIRAHRSAAHLSAQSPLGEIHVTLALVAGRVQLTVADNGPGMPPAIAAAYLQPRPLPQGATHGFGHRIVHELAAASAGQLSIRVRPGLGTVFCLKWPVANNLSTVHPVPSRMSA